MLPTFLDDDKASIDEGFKKLLETLHENQTSHQLKICETEPQMLTG